MEENRALVDLLAKGRSHVQELQTAATAFQPEDPTEAAMAHVSAPPLRCCAKRAMSQAVGTVLTGGRAGPHVKRLQRCLSMTAVRSCLQPS